MIKIEKIMLPLLGTFFLAILSFVFLFSVGYFNQKWGYTVGFFAGLPVLGVWFILMLLCSASALSLMICLESRINPRLGAINADLIVVSQGAFLINTGGGLVMLFLMMSIYQFLLKPRIKSMFNIIKNTQLKEKNEIIRRF